MPHKKRERKGERMRRGTAEVNRDEERQRRCGPLGKCAAAAKGKITLLGMPLNEPFTFIPWERGL